MSRWSPHPITLRQLQYVLAVAEFGSFRKAAEACAIAQPSLSTQVAQLESALGPRGFALKFYTEQGIWDLVGNNTPVFFLRDPSKFPDFIHTQKRHPQTFKKADPDYGARVEKGLRSTTKGDPRQVPVVK